MAAVEGKKRLAYSVTDDIITLNAILDSGMHVAQHGTMVPLQRKAVKYVTREQRARGRTFKPTMGSLGSRFYYLMNKGKFPTKVRAPGESKLLLNERNRLIQILIKERAASRAGLSHQSATKPSNSEERSGDEREDVYRRDIRADARGDEQIVMHGNLDNPPQFHEPVAREHEQYEMTAAREEPKRYESTPEWRNHDMYESVPARREPDNYELETLQRLVKREGEFHPRSSERDETWNGTGFCSYYKHGKREEDFASHGAGSSSERNSDIRRAMEERTRLIDERTRLEKFRCALEQKETERRFVAREEELRRRFMAESTEKTFRHKAQKEIKRLREFERKLLALQQEVENNQLGWEPEERVNRWPARSSWYANEDGK